MYLLYVQQKVNADEKLYGKIPYANVPNPQMTAITFKS